MRTFHALSRASVAAVLVFSTLSLAPRDAWAATMTITGTPPTSVTPGQFVAFTPRVSGAASRRLSFRISNRPAWMYFNSRSGSLYGVPRTRQAGSYANIRISVSDGRSTAALAPFTITVRVPGTTPPAPPPAPTPPAPTPTPPPPAPTPPPPPANRAPTIAGAPAPGILAGQSYSFVPAASDPDGNSLMFSIQNKPVWASFSTVNGALTGSPGSSNAGLHSNISIRVTDGSLSATLPAFAINVTVPAPPPPPAPTPPANRAPTISGSPATSVTAGSAYNFTPSSNDPDGNTLTFSITGKPTWATLNPQTGRLSGTPAATHVGTYASIVIRVSDGTTSVSLAPFAINVKPATLGSVTLNWTAPTQNTSGSALTNLAGYRIQYGNSVNALSQTVQLANPSLTTYLVENLAPGSWYFSLKAYDASGAESAPTNPVRATVP
jgi:hypothetical protein